MAKFGLHLLRLIGIKVGVLHGLQKLVVYLWVLYAQLVAAVLVEEGHGRAILHRPPEVVDRDVAAKRPGGKVVVLQDGRPGKAQTRGRGQKTQHVICKDAVVGAVGLVGENHYVVIRIDGLGVRLVELLDEREDVAWIALQLLDQVLPACGPTAGGGHACKAATALEGLAYLAVELIAICQHKKRGRAGLGAPDLLGKKHHGIALARALGVPEDTQLALAQSALRIGANRLIYAQVLVVSGHNLCRRRAKVVKEHEVLEEVEKNVL